MKILFYYRGCESLGVGYLMAALGAAGHEVKLAFDPGLDDNLYVRLPALAPLNRVDRMLRSAAAFGPDLVAFSVPSNLFPFVRAFMERLRTVISAPFILGGPHPTLLPEYVIRDPLVDMICIGEGEAPLTALAADLEAGRCGKDVPGLWVKDRGALHKNRPAKPITDLDRLPLPNKEPFYKAGCFRNRVSVLTSRGCPFRCTFCCNIALNKASGAGLPLVRHRSVEGVVKEVREWKSRYRPRAIWFCDDVFGTRLSWLESFTPAFRRAVDLPFDDALYLALADSFKPALDFFFDKPAYERLHEAGHFVTSAQRQVDAQQAEELTAKLADSETEGEAASALTEELAELKRRLAL